MFPRANPCTAERTSSTPQVSTIDSRARLAIRSDPGPTRPSLSCSQWAGPPATREKSAVDGGAALISPGRVAQASESALAARLLVATDSRRQHERPVDRSPHGVRHGRGASDRDGHPPRHGNAPPPRLGVLPPGRRRRDVHRRHGLVLSDRAREGTRGGVGRRCSSGARHRSRDHRSAGLSRLESVAGAGAAVSRRDGWRSSRARPRSSRFGWACSSSCSCRAI